MARSASFNAPAARQPLADSSVSLSSIRIDPRKSGFWAEFNLGTASTGLFGFIQAVSLWHSRTNFTGVGLRGKVIPKQCGPT
jgi:hypothetical protein